MNPAAHPIAELLRVLSAAPIGFFKKRAVGDGLASRDDLSLASAIEADTSGLVSVWLALGENGPAGVSNNAGDDDVRSHYLTPLARLLVGALRGSATHRAVYLDERTRYLPPGLDAAARAALLQRRLGVEAAAFTNLFASANLRPESVRKLFADLHADLQRPPSGKQTRLLLAGDCIFTETRAFIQQQARDRSMDIDIDHVFFSSTLGAFSVDDVLASIARSPPDLIGMSLFSFEGIPPFTALLRGAAQLSAAELDARVAGLVDLLGDAIDKIRAATDAPILLHTVCGLPLHGVRRRIALLAPLSRSTQRVVGLIAEKVADLAATRENTLLVDEIKLVEEAGGHHACNRPVFASRDMPPAVFHTSHFGNVLAKHYLEVVEAYRTLGRAKVLLVDFDNTLWSGVMAEGPVQHNLEVQRLLKRLKDAGILLVALSKNSPANIRWSEMALTRDDFVLHKISWEPKPEGASQAVAELDLAPASFVLLDDNPAERALVTEQVPGIKALDSGLPETWRALERWLDFPSTKQTQEARRRTELYREAAERRRAVAGAHDYSAMMRSLELRLGFRVAKISDLERLLELTQRTNQFNTTTKRRSSADVKALLTSQSHAVYVASLRDRFGSLGVVAVAIIERALDGDVIFDSVIMSCRAMGYGLEQTLVRKVIEREPGKRYIGLFVPTERNSPAAGLFGGTGFRSSDAGHWVLEKGDELVAMPSWFADDD